MSQTTQTDIITLGDVATRLPSFIPKVPHILNGLKQAYLRTSNTQQVWVLLLKSC